MPFAPTLGSRLVPVTPKPEKVPPVGVAVSGTSPPARQIVVGVILKESIGVAVTVMFCEPVMVQAAVTYV